MTPLQTYLPLAMVFGLALALGFALVGLAALLGPRRPSRVKAAPFECGSDPIGDARERFGVKFYVIALLFVVFDIEAVFIYPWAVLVRELGWTGFVSMAVFAATLLAGLAYVWKKGALDWSEHGSRG
jgi:NADH-quinone oxidoreductase subunit A